MPKSKEPSERRSRNRNQICRSELAAPTIARLTKGRQLRLPYRQSLEDGSAHFLRNSRIGGNGVPSFRAWMRTLTMLRLNAPAARTIDAPCATRALRRSLSASVQDPDIKRAILHYLNLAALAHCSALSDLMGSSTSTWWTCSHFGHSNVRKSEPARPGSIRASIMRP
jgi:hypothetical protein